MANCNPIFVTGSGRSGTSLCMYLLESMGAAMSPEMTPSSQQNPEGGQEDIEIFQIHQNLYRHLNTNSVLPMPTHWMEHESIAKEKAKLGKILTARLSDNPDHPWAMKDPNLSNYLPIWFQLCNAQKVTPVHVLCIRQPESMARSMATQYGRGIDESLMMWMLRNAYALRYTGGNCIVIHYEDWERDGATQLSKLAQYTGLSKAFEHRTPSDVLDAVYKRNLDRSSAQQEGEVSNPVVRRLYAALRAVSGGNVAGREPVMAAEACLAEIDQFRGMAIVAQTAIKQVAEFKKRLQQQQAISNTESVLQEQILKQQQLNSDLAKHLRFVETKLLEQREQIQELSVNGKRS